MSKEQTVAALFEAGLVAIIRKLETRYIGDTAVSLKRGGCKFIEITLDGGEALEQIAMLAEDEEAVVGAGTVLDATACRSAIGAGARFIVTPTLEEGVIRAAQAHGIPTIIGALTPTEILHAHRAGADVVKLFPAGSLGPAYIKNVLAPLADLPIMATGGVGLDNLQDFKAAGVRLFGIGSSMVDKRLIYAGEYTRIVELTRDYIQLIQGQ